MEKVSGESMRMSNNLKIMHNLRIELTQSSTWESSAVPEVVKPVLIDISTSFKTCAV